MHLLHRPQQDTIFNSIIKFSLLFLLFFSSVASAHEIRPAIVDFTFNKAGYYQLIIQQNIEALLAQVGDQHDDTEQSENAAKYDRLRQLPAEELTQEFEKFSETFLSKMTLKFDGKEEPVRILDVEVPEVGDLDLARDSVINIAGLIPEGVKSLSWQWDKSFGNAVFRVSSEDNPDLYSSYLTEGKGSDPVVIGLDCSIPENQSQAGCASQTGWWQTLVNYIAVGFDHIVPKGLDHILFVVGLFLLSTRLKPLLIQVTSFTLAHSVTLALGIFGVISISPAIVEPLIAASIVYVCVENIFHERLSRLRPVLVFLFGLLHGLGFASVLTEFGLTQGNFVSGLIGFNIGVELGQLSVIAACFLLFGYWFGKKSWYHARITIPASIVIALIAAYWFIERVGWI
ncbi:HupE/UreJ family protein [Cocleimonas sp. KMM 6892]|uniref:HupE/UreJ family protein n=1 Tax=unclassified Cocleimonas TaxID=2639732 RepID=UPI002DBA8E23|nr:MULTISPECIES: HupE/UreJ family protein [unclassified Cocleimonas]MEB8434530.1 HupE/UreJ family protein [Cocleimonas sp. KMM 6892]MEC4717423.1 HupE/UreJ family protein [Cocleimonas sp. KMM 6895]MEC4746783.1 HupE/UreJ family protein [Cocleimonas sp. KMM 6896]